MVQVTLEAHFDPEADAVTIRLTDLPWQGHLRVVLCEDPDLKGDVLVDLTLDDTPVQVSFTNASRFLPVDLLARLKAGGDCGSR